MAKPETAKDLMFTLEQIYKATMLWYGSLDRDSCCLAENRLMRGEIPE